MEFATAINSYFFLAAPANRFVEAGLSYHAFLMRKKSYPLPCDLQKMLGSMCP